MKINLGSSRLKKSYFPISFDSSTTSNFGECIPTFCQEVVPDSNVNINLRSAVRFAPLSLPTFGKAYLHNYAFYNKFSDLWEPFNDFLAGTPFTRASGTTYVPTRVPSLSSHWLWYIVLNHCDFTVWNAPSTPGSMLPSSSPISLYNGTLVVNGPNSIAEVDKIANGLVATLAWAVSRSTSNDLFSYLNKSNRKCNLIYNFGDSAPCRYRTVSTDQPDVEAAQLIYPAGADYMVHVNTIYSYNNTTKTFSDSGLRNDYGFIITIKLNNSGKFLRKIFMGLGYQIKNVSKLVSILPLFAYYKSYFNTFAPKRFIKYGQTSFGRLMNHIVQTGSEVRSALASDSVDNSSPLPGMIDDLLSCFYTEDTDYYSSQIIGLVNDYGSSLSQRYLGTDASGSNVNLESVEGDSEHNAPPSLNFEEAENLGHTQAQQNVLSRLTSFINRRSLTGGKISELLKSVFGIQSKDVFDEDNPYIGSSIIDVDFSDVFSTAETSEASLGEYAGRAMGSGSSDRLSVNCSSHGVVICFSCVVPRTQKVQGFNPNLFHVNRSDFYNPMFDGLTLLPTDRLSLYAVDSFIDSTANVSASSFGNQSLFAEYKTRTQGILNGDLSLLSTKSSYDSFTLDQTISNYVYQSIHDDPKRVSFDLVSPNVYSMAAGTMWRYIGRWLWLGNFDRIFVNTRLPEDSLVRQVFNFTFNQRDLTVSDDNLVIHNVVDLRSNAPMLPLEDSYMTKDLDELTNSVGTRTKGE